MGFSKIIRRNPVSGNQRGFTLIEMISAIVLMGVMGIFSIQFIASITQTSQLTTGQKELVDEAKLAMEYLIRELRVATEDAADIAYTADSITFDKYSGYTVDTSKIGIKYAWNSGTQILTRTSGAPTLTSTTLATQITGFTVAESPAAGSHFYVFTLTLQGPNGENFTLNSGVRPRSTL